MFQLCEHVLFVFSFIEIMLASSCVHVDLVVLLLVYITLLPLEMSLYFTETYALHPTGV